VPKYWQKSTRKMLMKLTPAVLWVYFHVCQTNFDEICNDEKHLILGLFIVKAEAVMNLL